jgi:acyl-CoA synthetase (AMP-forming)/AMP-acid ligase II
MTETFGPHTWGGEGALAEADRGSFGPPLPYVEHRVVDPATGAPVGPGEVGEICVRGRTLMQGLYKVEREDAFDADGFYRTGDAGFFDAGGRLFFEGRLGDLIKSGGANVTPSEVEIALMAYAEVKVAHVVGVPDAERGQNVAAAVVLEPGVPAVPADELKRRLKAGLSAYKVPRHLWVLRDDELPFTDTGKLHKGRLAALLANRIARGDRG